MKCYFDIKLQGCTYEDPKGLGSEIGGCNEMLFLKSILKN